jgi:hypothetical protein
MTDLIMFTITKGKNFNFRQSYYFIRASARAQVHAVADAVSDQMVFVGERVDFDGSRSTAPSGASLKRFQWDFQNDSFFDAEGEHVSYIFTSI